MKRAGQQDTAANKKQHTAEAVKLSEISIKGITGKVAYIRQNLDCVGVDVSIRYKKDVEKITDARMNEALKHREEHSGHMKSIVDRLEKAHGDDDNSSSSSGSAEEAPADDKEKEDGINTGIDALDDSDTDADDTKDMEVEDAEDVEDADLSSKQKLQILKMRLFTRPNKLPILNPFSTMKFIMKPDTKRFPPTFDDMIIVLVESVDCKKDARPVGTVLNTLQRVAPWMRKTAISKVSLRSKNAFRRVDDLIAHINDPRCWQVTYTLFRDYFRCREFYWFIGLIPQSRLSYLTDDYCMAAYGDIVSGRFEKHIFSSAVAPLSLELLMTHKSYGFRKELKSLQTGEDVYDIDAYALVYEAAVAEQSQDATIIPIIDSDVVTTSMMLANELWIHWWTRLGLYQGRFVWTARDCDIPPDLRDDRLRAALGYLLHKKLISRHVNADDLTCSELFLPEFVLGPWRALRRMQQLATEGLISLACFEGDIVSLLTSRMMENISAKFKRDERLLVCPTMQSAQHAAAEAHCVYYNMGKANYREFAVYAARHLFFIFVDTHLFSCHQLRGCLLILCKAARAAKRPIHVILSGISTHITLSERDGRGCQFHTLLGSMSDKGFESVMADDLSAFQITSEQLEEAKAQFVTLSSPMGLRLRTVVMPVSVKGDPLLNTYTDEESGQLNKWQMESILSCIKPMIDCPSELPFLMFENNAHMQQVLSNHRVSEHYSHNILKVGCFAVEPDGGVRKIRGLWMMLRPGCFQPVSHVNIDDCAPEMIEYAMDEDPVEMRRGLSGRKIRPSGYACISKARVAPLPVNVDVVAFFTMTHRRYRRSDFNTLTYVARRKLVIATFEKPAALRMYISENIGIQPVNIYDYSGVGQTVATAVDE